MNPPKTIIECGPYLHWTFEDPTKSNAQKNVIIGEVIDKINTVFLKTDSINTRDALGHTMLSWLVIVKNWCEQLHFLINYLITELDAEVNSQDARGFSALHWAVLFDRTECVRLLMSRGAIPTLKDVNGKDCIYYARENEYWATLNELERT